MWIYFLRDFDFTPPEKTTATVAYRAGTTAFVRRVCAMQAIKIGAAITTRRPTTPAAGAI